MGSTATSVLRTMRSPNVVNGLGLGFVGVIVLWLVVNFFKDPTYFLNIGLDGLTRGTVYGVVALGYTLVYGILQLINFAHGDVFALSGLVASTLMLSVLSVTPASSNAAVAGAVIVTLLVTIPLFAVANASIERVAYRPLRNAPRVAPLITAVGMSLHRPERVARALRRRLRERLGADPAGRRVPHRRRPLHVEARRSRSRSSFRRWPSSRGSSNRPARGRPCVPSLRTRRPRR